MDRQMLISNFTNPTLLFFVLGAVARLVGSDLEIPSSIARFLSIYLLFSIGFKGGQELSHSAFTSEIGLSLVFGVVFAALVPLGSFFVLRRRLGPVNAGAVAASYGSVSAVTFVAATSFLEAQHLTYGGHMVAVMAMMEAPAIVVGVMLIHRYGPAAGGAGKLREVLRHALTNGSVLLVLGSLCIGIVADAKQAEGIRPFTSDIFKGFLALFLLEMGMATATRLSAFLRHGWFAVGFAVLAPAVNGVLAAYASGLVTDDVGNRFLFAILGASASYIAVPAAMRIAAPDADPGLYIPMALGVTFPFNLTLGMPLYLAVIRMT